MKTQPRNTESGREALGGGTWKRVPRINLISERRRYRPSTLSLFLALVIVVEALAVQIIHSDLQPVSYTHLTLQTSDLVKI